MQNRDIWQTFEKTGLVTDYLKYKNIDIKTNQEKERAGEQCYGTKYNCDGHDTVGIVYGGI